MKSKNLSAKHAFVGDFILLGLTFIVWANPDIFVCSFSVAIGFFSPLIFLLINSILLSSNIKATMAQFLCGAYIVRKNKERVSLIESIFLSILMFFVILFPLWLIAIVAASNQTDPSIGMVIISLVFAIVLYKFFSAISDALFFLKNKEGEK